jgi:cysteine-rich repeat protein
LAEGSALIGAPSVHAQGFTGVGIRVAVLDTGIDTDHPHLSDDIAAQQCFCDNHPAPVRACCPNGAPQEANAEDDNGHGTSTSGIVTSSRVAGPGIAPDAEIVAVKVLDSGGSGNFSDVAAGLDWLITNQTSLGLNVVNMSLGDGTQHDDASVSPCSGSNTANAIESLHALGVVVFVSSGNDGHDNGIAFPACVAEAISVGGVYDANVGGIQWCGNATCTTILCTDNPTFADLFVCHTNSGSLLDILAPNFRTATTTLGGGTNFSFGGTSASSPYAAAKATLLLQADPTLTPEQIRTLMKTNGPSVTNPESGLSFTRTDVNQAFEALAPATCGNNDVETGEDCDDGNTAPGDCCSDLCAFEAAGGPCEDGDACTVSDTCDGGGVCDPGPPLACDDGQFCNGLETCDSGSGCVDGPDPVIDDGITCTDDSCDEVGDVVVNTPNHALCDDTLFCTGVETCHVTLDCQAGTNVDCDDVVSCTVDVCNETTDQCDNMPDDAVCNDANVCTEDVCDAALDCQNDPIVGCSLPVPTSTDWTRLALALILLGAGAGLVGGTRRRPGNR